MPQAAPAVPKAPEAAKPAQESPTPEEMLRRLNAEAHDSPLTPLPDTKAGRFGATLGEVIPALAASGAAARTASPERLSCQAEALERIRAATCYGPLRKFFSTVESILFVFAASVAMGGLVAAVDASEKGSPGLVVAALAGGAVGALVLGFVARAGKQAALLMVDIADCQIQQVARLGAEATE